MHFWKASTLVLAATLSYVVVDGTRDAHADAQPHMKVALGQLEGALAQLEKATSDKGGHRVAAIKSTRDAIAQTKKGIAFDDAR